MRASDWAAWASACVALLALFASSFAVALSWKSLKWEKDSAESARRSAEAAERSNLLAERALKRVPGPSAPPGGDMDDGRVSWRVERAGGSQYVLRNTGAAMAEHVAVDRTAVKCVASNLPTDAVARPGEGLDIMLQAAFGAPLPRQLYVRWGAMGDWSAVPMPSAHE